VIKTRENTAEEPVLCQRIHHPCRLHNRKSLAECSGFLNSNMILVIKPEAY